MKIKYFAIPIITLSTLISLTSEAQAIQTKYYYDGEQPNNLKAAGNIAKKYSNSIVYRKRIGNNPNSKYKAVGYIKNMNGFAGRNVEVQGTGTVIDDYTVLTNAHVVDDQYHNTVSPRYLTFYMNRNGNSIPYKFSIKSIKKIKGADIALIYTNKKLTNYVKPLTFATESQIKQLKTGRFLYSVGYPYINAQNRSYRYWHKLMFLRNTYNGKELMTKDIMRGGNSGSVMVDGKYKIYGVRTYGERVDGYDENIYAKYEVAGGFAIKGQVRKDILKYKY